MDNKISKRKFWGVLLGIAAVIYLSPLYLVLVNSFKTNREYMLSMISFPSGFNISDSYLAAIKQIDYYKLFGNSIYVLLFALAGIVLFGSMTAYKLCRVSGRLSTIIFFIFLSCLIIPFQGLMIPLIKMLASFHLVNTLTGLGIVNLVMITPVVIFMYHGFIKTIPYEIEESARIDGANGYFVFFRIIFPLLRSITLTVLTLFGLVIWNDFLMPLLILQKSSKYTLPLGVTIFFKESSNRPSEWPAIYAALVISSAPVMIFFFCMQKYMVSGIASGAVKG